MLLKRPQYLFLLFHAPIYLSQGKSKTELASMPGTKGSKKGREEPTSSLPKPASAQQPRPLPNSSQDKEEILTEGQEFYRAADILQAEHLLASRFWLKRLARMHEALHEALHSNAHYDLFKGVKLSQLRNIVGVPQ